MTKVNKFNPSITVKYLEGSLAMSRKQIKEVTALIKALDLNAHATLAAKYEAEAEREVSMTWLKKLYYMDTEQTRQLKELAA